MTFDLAKILDSKRAFRERLSSRPIAEKLAMLDAPCVRAISRSKSGSRPTTSHHNPPPGILPSWAGIHADKFLGSLALVAEAVAP